MDLKEVLDAVNSAMTVVKHVANLPGVNLIPYVSTVAGAIDALQRVYNAGKDIAPYVVAIKDTFSIVPNAQQLAALDAKIAELEAKVQEPLPPPEEGEDA